jgi:hypothetical protein
MQELIVVDFSAFGLEMTCLSSYILGYNFGIQYIDERRVLKLGENWGIVFNLLRLIPASNGFCGYSCYWRPPGDKSPRW